jgi:SPP1 gp7 family putative phage head morphogenesis protein
MSELDRIIERHQAALQARDQATLAEMAQRWRALEASLEPQMELLAQEIQQRGLRNTNPGQIARLERYQTLLQQVREQIALYSQTAAPYLAQQQQQYAQLGLFDSAQYFDVAAMTAFNRLRVEALNIAIGLAGDGTPLQELLARTWPDAVDRLTQELINGLGEGLGSREVARRMVRGTGASLTRAQTIARTETLRVYREASRQQYAAAGVEQWIRIEAKDRRTCPGCLALDGTRYPMDQRPYDHPNGRMTLIPELSGLPARQSMQEWFRAQPEQQQREQLESRRRYDGWRRGLFDWSDMAKVVDDPVWGPSVQVRPLSELGV